MPIPRKKAAAPAAAQKSKSYFAGARDAKISNRNPYMEPGQKYRLKLLKSFVLETREKGDAFIAEFEIVSTTSEKQRVGTKVSFYQGLAKKDVAFGSIKALVYALLGVDPEAKTEDELAEIDEEIEDEMQKAVDENHLAGQEVLCVTSTRRNKEDTGDYTQHHWSPVAAEVVH